MKEATIINYTDERKIINYTDEVENKITKSYFEYNHFDDNYVDYGNLYNRETMEFIINFMRIKDFFKKENTLSKREEDYTQKEKKAVLAYQLMLDGDWENMEYMNFFNITALKMLETGQIKQGAIK